MSKNMVQNGDLQIVNFTVDEVSYGVPVDQVREVRDIQAVTPVPGAPNYVKGVTNLRGQIIPVMDLRTRFGLPEKNVTGEKILIIDLDKHSVGVVVDTVTEVSILKEHDIEKSIKGATEINDSIIGVGKQGDKLTVILDMEKVTAKPKD